MKERIFYYPGFKIEYFIPGFLLFITSIAFCFTSLYWISFVLIPISILLMLALQGTEIDYSEKKLIKYTDLLAFKVKTTTSLEGYEVVSIVFEKKSGRTNGIGWFNVSGNSFYNSSSREVQYVSFEMYLYGFIKEKFYLCDFGSHADARKIANQLNKFMGIKIEDTIMDTIQFYQKNPHRRRR